MLRPFRTARLAVLIGFALSVRFCAAGESGLFASLPRHSAIAGGADIAALRSHRQCAPFFADLPDGGAPGLNEIVCSCDRVGNRNTVLCRFLSSAAVDDLHRRYADRLSPAEYAGDIPVHWFGGKPDGSDKVRMARLGADTVAVYSHYPKKGAFTADRRGVPAALRRFVPQRSGVLIWGAGLPGFTDPPLDAIRTFSFVLEPDVDGKLVIHGEVICINRAKASFLRLSMPGALSVLLGSRYGVPAPVTMAAVSALGIRQEDAALRFSSGDVRPVLQLLSRIIRQQLSAGETAEK